MKILALESSCDETSVAVSDGFEILSNEVATQAIHTSYGGVVPELASRLHIQSIVPLTEQALRKSNTSLKCIDAFAFSQMPGLLGSLLVGSSFVKSLAIVYQKPLVGVNHVHAHITSNFIGTNKLRFPFLCLTVSGGHTQIHLCKKINSYKLIGTTLDDAAGEAFDKSAKLIGLNYPGGALIDKLSKNADENKFTFPKPNIKGYDYSFSGLKTSILYFLREEVKKNTNFIKNNLKDLSASIQKTIVDILLEKLFKAAADFKIKNICIAGGVSANSKLRIELKKYCLLNELNYFYPHASLCTDNAAMIAVNAYLKFLDNDLIGMDSVPSAAYTFTF